MYYEILRRNNNTGHVGSFWIEAEPTTLDEFPVFPMVEGDEYLVLRRVGDEFVWNGFSGSRHLGWQ